MAKTIVICCDGTWNKPKDAAETNIWRTFELLCRSTGAEVPSKDKVCDNTHVEGVGPDGGQYLLYYDCGVGTAQREKVRGGVFGYGLDLNVKQAYAFVAEHWQPGDRLFCFGFSRGAFTVRALCGMLGAGPLAQTADRQAVDEAYARYRLPPRERAKPDGWRPGERDVFVDFLGVYDTVGSLGVPIPRLRFLNRLSGGRIGHWLLGDVTRFHDTALGRNVEIACQALAIDERRGAFRPVVWSRAPGVIERDGGAPRPQRALQVWFCGAHGDVGGGYPESDLADTALNWMLRRAGEAGLHIDPAALGRACQPNPWGARHDSANGWLGRLSEGRPLEIAGQIASSLPLPVSLPLRILDWATSILRIPAWTRVIGGEHLADDDTYSVAVNEKLHESVLARYRGRPMPEALRRPLDAGLEIFRERAAPRRRPFRTAATIAGHGCRLVDVSTTGAQVMGIGWLDPETQHTLESEETGRRLARVVWQEGDRVGLRFVASQTAGSGPHPTVELVA